MNSPARVIVLISDLDGTLLDASTYSAQAAAAALSLLKTKHIVLVLSSSKTLAEMEEIRRQLNHHGPFIVENGGALVVPLKFFPSPFKHSRPHTAYEIVEFGVSYHALRTALSEIARIVGVNLHGFGDMSVKEISRLTGLSSHEATLAKQRAYDEPFLLEADETFPLICREAEKRGLMCTKGGRFYHLLGLCDKGHACQVLLKHWQDQLESPTRLSTIGIGDSANDLPMLAIVDQAILVQGPDGSYDPTVRLPNLMYAPGIGPIGWNAAILELFQLS